MCCAPNFAVLVLEKDLEITLNHKHTLLISLIWGPEVVYRPFDVLVELVRVDTLESTDLDIHP